IGNRRSTSSCADRGTSASAHRDCDRQWATGKTRTLSAQKFVLSAGDPLHWGRHWLYHRRSDCDPRLGRPLFSRLVSSIDGSAAHFHSAISPRFGTPVVDLEIWREIAAAATLSDQ